MTKSKRPDLSPVAKGSRILVTGASGFIGRHLTAVVAQDIGQPLLTEVDHLNSERRRSRAYEERRFITVRLDSARVRCA